MPSQALFQVVSRLLLAVAAFAAPLALSACSDEEGPAVQPLAGSNQGMVRYVVHLKGDPPDASAYRAALAEDPAKAAALAEELKQVAADGRKKLVQALRAYDGRVVDHWFLTNAVTVEIPEGNALSLQAIDGVERVEPDQLLVE